MAPKKATPEMTQAAIQKLVRDSVAEALRIEKERATVAAITEAATAAETARLAYIKRFQELTVLCPAMFSDNEKLLKNFIGGLSQNIQGDVTSFDPQTTEESTRITQILMAQVVKKENIINNNHHNNNNNHTINNNNNRTNYHNNQNNNYNDDNQINHNKRKWENDQGGYHNNNQSCSTNHHQQQNRRQEAARVYVAAPTKEIIYTGNLPRCHQCTLHHDGPCGICFICQKVGHLAKDCKGKGYAGTHLLCTRCNFHHSGLCPAKCRQCQKLGHLARDCRGKTIMTCFECGEQGHYRSQCPQNQGQQVEGAHGNAYMLGGGEARQGINDAED